MSPPNTNNLPDEDYDPYYERYTRKPLKNWESFNLIIRGCIGSGLLSLPEAFRFSGMLVGIVDTVVLAIFITYMYHVLMKSRLTLCKILRVGRLYYPQAMKQGFKIGPGCIKIFSPVIGITVDLLSIVQQLCFLCAYLKYMAEELKRVFEVFYNHDFPLYAYVLIVGPYLLIIMSVNNIKVYAVFAVLSNIVTLVSLGFMLYYLMEDLPNFTLLPPASSPSNHLLYVIPAMASLQSLPLTSTIELNMLSGHDFLKPRGILCQSYATLTITYLIIAVLGYWRYEQNTLAFITLNFDIKDWVVQVILIMYFIGVYISYGLQGLIGVDIIWAHYFSRIIKTQNDFFKGVIEYTFRYIIFVGVPLIIVLYLPTDLNVIFFTHGICLSFLTIIFPALLEISVRWPNQKFGSCNYIFIKDIFLVILGLLLLGISGYHGYRFYSGNISTFDSWW